jgi:hypothetical protein
MKKNEKGRSATIFYFSPSLQGNEERLRARIETSFPDARLEVHTRYPDFALRLIHPKDETSVAVVALTGRDETTGLLPVRDMISDTPLIVVLPDDHPETIRMAHRLRPQFIGYFDSDFEEVVSVIGRLIDIRRTRMGRPDS